MSISPQMTAAAPFLLRMSASIAELAAGCAGGPTYDQILGVALQRRGLLQRCVLEALRLRGAGLTVRMAMSDLELPNGDGGILSVRKVSSSAPAARVSYAKKTACQPKAGQATAAARTGHSTSNGSCNVWY